uniref:Zinc finger BED domain-containing protein 1 n=1 Tax=Lygus hesperus TaxID=30085 RepID=A0A0A9WPC3_LYGHE
MSSVWEYFKKLTDSSAMCNLCGKTYKTCGNATNATTHLKRKHPQAHRTFSEKKKKETPTLQPKLSFNRPSTSGSSTPSENVSSDSVEDDPLELSDIDEQTSPSAISSRISAPARAIETLTDDGSTKFVRPPPPTPTKQGTLPGFFEARMSYEEGGAKHTELTQALVFMICRDNLPFACVDKPGLNKFCKVAAPRYKLPCRATITKLVEQRYVTTVAIMKKIFGEADVIALTSDVVTVPNSTRSFLLVTAHLLNSKDGELEGFCIAAKRLSEAQTGEYISSVLTEITVEFCIEKSQIVSVTTDGGGNMLAAVKTFIGEKKSIRCCAHLINAVVNDVLKAVPLFSKLCDHRAL